MQPKLEKMLGDSKYGNAVRTATYRDLETCGVTCPDPKWKSEPKHKEFLAGLIGIAEGRRFKDDIDEHNKKVAWWGNAREQRSRQRREYLSNLSSNHIV